MYINIQRATEMIPIVFPRILHDNQICFYWLKGFIAFTNNVECNTKVLCQIKLNTNGRYIGIAPRSEGSNFCSLIDKHLNFAYN